MFKMHEHLDNVGDNVILWKFMELPKFINLLNGELYFNRLDNFEDVYEGTYPAYNKVARSKVYPKGEQLDEETYVKLMEKAQKTIFVSCFHNSRSETAFMWKVYSKDYGVAIKTSGKRLKNAFIDEEDVYISKVNYIDYEKEFLPEGNILYLGTHKRKSFNTEKEYRCIIWDENEIKKGKMIKVDLNKLIQTVYLSPYSPDYMVDDIRKVMKERNIIADVKKSELLTLK